MSEIQAPEAKPARKFVEVPETVTKQLTWSCGDKTMEYEAIAGHIPIREDDGEPICSIFTLTYRTLPADPSRPVTFMYNGGPGSASVLINVGGFGPRSVVPNGDRRIGPAPFQVIDNPLTLLTTSDLVFIDAPTTGWSIMAEGVDAKTRAWGVDQDVDCFARAIESWLQAYGRWNSPLYLFGESYGTMRSSLLVKVLEDMSIPVSGVVLLSAILDRIPSLPGADYSYVIQTPAYANIAQYFGRSKRGEGMTSEDLFWEASEFAEDVLAPALLKGDRLDAACERDIAECMADLIGLPADYIASKHLRIELTDFRQHLLADEHKCCGRLDGRYTYEMGNPLQTSAEGCPEGDPSDSATMGAWYAAWRNHVNSEIGYTFARPYIPSNWANAGMNWNHVHTSAGVAWHNMAANVSYDLAYAMRHNEHLKVLVLGGLYDLATPFLSPIEDMSKMFFGPEIKKNLTFKCYDSGHMIYAESESFKAMAADLEEWYRA